MAATDIPLKNLAENNYNPRLHFDDAAMADIEESIASEGLNQALTVRPVGENGTYEVNSGERRLFALRSIYGEGSDEPIPCNVREIDDDDAPWTAFAENKHREDLTIYEEAKFFADHITVEYRDDDDGDPIEETYAEYLDAVGERDGEVRLPSKGHPSIKDAVGRTGVNATTISERRLSLSILPDDAQWYVEQDDLGPSEVKLISRLRHIPDAEKRTTAMNNLAEQFAVDDPDREKLRKKVDAKIEADEEEREQQEAQVEQYEDLVVERDSDLTAALGDAGDDYDDIIGDGLELGPDSVATEGIMPAITEEDEDGPSNERQAYIYAFVAKDDRVPEANNWLRARCQQAIRKLESERSARRGEKMDDLDDAQTKKEREMGRLKKNIETAREEHLSRCPYCKAGLRLPDLEDRVAKYEDEIQSLIDQQKDLGAEAKDLADARKALRKELNNYNSAVKKLLAAKKQAGIDDSDGTGGEA